MYHCSLCWPFKGCIMDALCLYWFDYRDIDCSLSIVKYWFNSAHAVAGRTDSIETSIKLIQNESKFNESYKFCSYRGSSAEIRQTPAGTGLHKD